MVRKLAFGAMLAVLPLGAEAADQTIHDGFTLAEVQEVMGQLGFAPKPAPGPDDLWIEGSWNGVNFAVFLYSCEGQPPRCTGVQMRADFQFPDAAKAQPALDLNAKNVFGRVYFPQPGTLRLDYAMHTNGGVTGDNLANNFDLWKNQLQGFTEAIGW